ncbi:MAG: hypothetical protein HGA36_05280 [Candidatus Moranbacteria bacterium]|nr:hypothetical protein [Candidatus Moranbacteria bacterium]
MPKKEISKAKGAKKNCISCLTQKKQDFAKMFLNILSAKKTAIAGGFLKTKLVYYLAKRAK